MVHLFMKQLLLLMSPLLQPLDIGKKQLDAHGEDTLQPKKKGRLSMKKETKKQSKNTLAEGSVEELQARIKQLEMENENLKKLNALVQAKEKSPRKTR